MNLLVDPIWLAERRADPLIKVLDCSWYMPSAQRDPAKEYELEHIPGAQFFDIDAHSDATSPWPHMLPSVAKFESAMSALGISNQTKVLVYDTAGLFSAPRVWWMLRAMGHEHVYVLNGGFPAWKAVDYPVAKGTVPTPPSVPYKAQPNPAIVRSFVDIRRIAQEGTAQILDARGAPRFHAQEPEPRPGVRGGHIPGSRNVHYASLLTANGRLKPVDQLRALFVSKGIELDRPIVTSCGSGITAAILMLALLSAGAEDVALYDGSWSEWGARLDAPIETD